MNATYRVIDTAVGPVAFVATSRGLRRLLLPRSEAEDPGRRVGDEFPEATEDSELLPAFAENLRAYFAGEPVDFDVSIDYRGLGATWFEIDVWRACREIAYGETRHYKDLAQRVGRPNAARAVGMAMRHNPLPIVVPCHRVVKSDGSLGGYNGPEGVDFKRRLLEMESAPVVS